MGSLAEQGSLHQCKIEIFGPICLGRMEAFIHAQFWQQIFAVSSSGGPKKSLLDQPKSSSGLVSCFSQWPTRCFWKTHMYDMTFQFQVSISHWYSKQLAFNTGPVHQLDQERPLIQDDTWESDICQTSLSALLLFGFQDRLARDKPEQCQQEWQTSHYQHQSHWSDWGVSCHHHLERRKEKERGASLEGGGSSCLWPTLYKPPFKPSQLVAVITSEPSISSTLLNPMDLSPKDCSPWNSHCSEKQGLLRCITADLL